MNRKGLLAFCLLIFLGILAGEGVSQAETIYLNTGESIKGKIVRVEEETISIESERGFGVIQIKRTDIVLIEFDEGERDLSRLFGVGFYHYDGQDYLSMKMWLSQDSSVDLLFSFYNASTGSNDSTIMTLDVRYASVFDRRGNLDLYWGASGGILNVNSTVGGTDQSESGTRMTAFLGVEMFFTTLPNLGISSEIVLYTESFENSDKLELGLTDFPTFAIRYYF